MVKARELSKADKILLFDFAQKSLDLLVKTPKMSKESLIEEAIDAAMEDPTVVGVNVNELNSCEGYNHAKEQYERLGVFEFLVGNALITNHDVLQSALGAGSDYELLAPESLQYFADTRKKAQV
jgi:hypothetical protein